MKRILVGLLAAYAASMTLLALQWGTEVWLYRRLLYDKEDPDHRPLGHSLLGLARDFGLPRTPLETWWLWIADFRAPLVAPAIVLFFLLGLGVPLIRKPFRTKLDKD